MSKDPNKKITQMDRLEMLHMVNTDALVRMMSMISLYSPAMRETMDEIRVNMIRITKEIHGDYEEDNSHEPRDIPDSELPSHEDMLKDLNSDPEWKSLVDRLDLPEGPDEGSQE